MKTSHFIIQLLIVLTLNALTSSCTEITSSLVTENQRKGINDIASYYGGDCSYTIDYGISTDEGKTKKVEIKIKKSPIVEKFAKVEEMCASNAAYIFYTDLKEEKKGLDGIKVDLEFNDGNSSAYNYRSGVLDTITSNMPVLNKVIVLIEQRNYDSIISMIPDTLLMSRSKDSIIKNFSTVDSLYGEVTNFQFYGFFVRKIENIQTLHMAGVLVRKKQNTNFNIEIDVNSKRHNLIELNYKL
jgi:hypothetical protein